MFVLELVLVHWFGISMFPISNQINHSYYTLTQLCVHCDNKSVIEANSILFQSYFYISSKLCF